MQPGRKSAAALLITPLAKSKRPKLSATESLTTAQQTTFDIMVRGNPHLVEADMPLLTLYVLSLSKATQLAKISDVKAWEKVVRLALTIGTKLRVTPQSCLSEDALGRKKLDQRHTTATAELLKLNRDAASRKPWQEEDDDAEAET
jgi:hypothetical protein